MQQASSLARLSVASMQAWFPTDCEKLRGIRAYRAPDNSVWEYAPRSPHVWRPCPQSRLTFDAAGNERVQLSATTDSGMRVQHPRAWFIAEHELGPKPAGHVVDHSNENPADDISGNLRYDTYSGNSQRSVHGKRLPLAVIAVHRDGTTLGFLSLNACARHFGCNGRAVNHALHRGTYAKRSHSPFKDWIITRA
jgi:hypothetical protein